MPFALLASDPAVVTAGNAAAVSIGGAVVAAFFGYLTAKSNSANDRDKAVMARDLADAKADLAEIKADRAEVKDRLEKAEGRLDECEKDRTRLHDENDAQRKAKHDALDQAQVLAGRVTALEIRLAAKPG